MTGDGDHMRITESRIRRIIREELIREMSGSGRVDELFANLVNTNPERSRNAAEYLPQVIELVKRDAGRVEDAVEGVTRLQRIMEIASGLPRTPGKDHYRVGLFRFILDQELRKLGLLGIIDFIEQSRREESLRDWQNSKIPHLIDAMKHFVALQSHTLRAVEEWNGDYRSTPVIMVSADFAYLMRQLDKHPDELELATTYRNGVETLVNFFKNPEYEDYHEQVARLVGGDLEDSAQAIELVSSLTM
jgi:hypothetical protein